MRIELINTGSELLLGQVLNSHQHWIGRQLADLGYELHRQVAVPDTGPAIQEAVREALSRSDCVITTGGLGPTSDDRTRDYIAELLEAELYESPEVLEHIESFFVKRKRPMMEEVKVQAQIPSGAEILMNAFGTAPGLTIKFDPNRFSDEGKPALLIMLPGPPRELHPMFTNQVIPILSQELHLDFEYSCQILRTTGLGESMVEKRITPLLENQITAGLEIGYCSRPGEVDVRLCARCEDAVSVVRQAHEIVSQRLKTITYGTGVEHLEDVVVRLLAQQNQTLALAESCTGGYIANRITNVSGASKVLDCAMVTYSNQAKIRLLGVSETTLDRHGAVSEATAREMAQGALSRTNADVAISVTGIAGPTGGSDEKPVGTVFIGLATRAHAITKHSLNTFDRQTFKDVTSQQALELLRRELVQPWP